MDSIRLKIQERAFPSRGRARLHESYLKGLGIAEGDEVEMYKDESASPVVVAVFADTLVDEGHIRLSNEDIASLGAAPGVTIIVKKRPPLGDRLKKTAEDTAEGIKSGAKKASESITGGAQKASESIREGATSAKESIEKGTESIGKKLKEKDL